MQHSLVFADGTAAHHACNDRPKAERVCRRPGADGSPESLADEAEVTVRGELT